MSYKLTLIYEQPSSISDYNISQNLTLEFDSRSEMLNFAEIAMRHHMEEKMVAQIEIIEKGEA